MIYESTRGPVFYDVCGPREAPAIVLTHGMGMDHATFGSQVAALCDRYRVFVWDMPGHGRSFPLDDDFRFSVVADCLLGMLDETGVGTAVLGGQSLGSLVSQYAAHRYPERVTALVDIGGAPLHEGMNRLHAFVWRRLLGISALIPEKMFYRWFARDKAVMPDAREYLEAAISRMGKRRVLRITRAFLQDYIAGIPEAPDVPLLITHGEHDAFFIRRSSAEWHANAPGSRFAVIPAAGHIASQDNPAAFNQVLVSFLAKVEEDRGTPALPEPALKSGWRVGRNGAARARGPNHREGVAEP